ncbi:MAG: excinuclease ABC subunit UvrA [Candidatus Aminicenantes bacterium]|nr:excinuclease ABC subunit UvrA [Candidatus Aminicenantes bacterium]
MTKNMIKLRGVKVNNLKNIDLNLPLNKLIVVTGVSGSGKSSLAFDTLYAEGQRRYIESLSAYARQFLQRMEKPDADLIEGITPAIAIQQKAVTKNPRSTVATVTEIYDFLRVLFARIGIVHCKNCGLPIDRDTIDGIVETLYRLPLGTKIKIIFTWNTEKGEILLKTDGFHRAVIKGKVIGLDKINFNEKPAIDILVDRLSVDKKDRERLVDSLETALRKGEGRLKIQTENGEEYFFSEHLECKKCGIQYEDPFPNLFSFNTPQGACPVCHGFGDLAVLDEDKVIPDPNKSLEEGAVEPWTKPGSKRRKRKLVQEAQQRGIPTHVPYKNLDERGKRFVFEGEGHYKGVKGFFDRLQKKKYKIQARVLLSRYRKYIPCPACQQSRLNPQALTVRVEELNIGQVVKKTVRDAYSFFSALPLSPYKKRVAEKLLSEIQNRLKFLLEVGLDYITLDRMTFTLSGGEAQRINLAAALGSSLVGTLFVLDEPSIGLHARDNHRLVDILKSLKNMGNTVLVVEHDPEIIQAADHLVDLGPGAGEKGGEVMYSGPYGNITATKNSLTAAFLNKELRIELPQTRRRPDRFIHIKKASKHNLKNIDVSIPLNTITCVTGVSGSGKSTLIYDVLYKGWKGETRDGFKTIEGLELINEMIMVDQAPISTSPRSIPATYTKILDEIRTIFSSTREAKAQGFKPGFFSFNTSGGRCEECQGAGQQIIEMQFLSDVVLTCESCKGKRFKEDILEIKVNSKNIDDVLRMSVTEAWDFFRDRPRILKKLKPLKDVGLGYLRLGQPTTTLSGGELQRIKLAHHLIHKKSKGILYLFDEPTIGLHLYDINILLDCFQKLVHEGHSVVIIEHNLDVIKCSDYIIDLGPEGGEGGGEVVVQGSPEDIVISPRSYTARFLKKHISA